MASFIPGPVGSMFVTTRPRLDRMRPRTCSVQTSRRVRRICRTRMQTDLSRAEDTNETLRSDMDVIQGERPEVRDQEEAAEETDEEVLESEGTEGGDSWYSVTEPIAKPDTGSLRKKRTEGARGGEDGIVDLAALDGMGREVLAGASYNQVVDVDIEEGGVLKDDEDNNELFCGVGLDALIESEQIMKNLREGLNIETATHVQLSAIPRVMDKRDIVIQSHTGTGKTLAFLLPLLDEIEVDRTDVQGIIVAPTRELAMQISRECERLCEDTGIRTLAIIGGANPARQVEKLRRRQPHVVVGTPGRVAELQEHRELRVRGVGMFVVDEVDQCIQTAMAEDVVYMLKAMMRRTQKVLVSATSDVDSVRSFAREYLHKPVLLRVGGSQRLPKQITHWFCVVPARMRIEMIRKLMNTNPEPTRAIAFVDDPRRVDLVVERLYQMKIVAGALRGNAYKLERAEVLTAFRKGKINLLVTTEVAARGLDIPEISHVFNIDLPTDGDHYVHRAGRCGRVRNPGTVVSITTAETAFVMGRLEKQLGVTMTRMEPRGGEYADVKERKRREDVPGKRMERKTQSAPRGTGTREAERRTSNASASTGRNTSKSQPDEEGFDSGQVINEAAIMGLVDRLDTEGRQAGAVGEEPLGVKKAKKRATAKGTGDDDGKGGKKDKPKVKLRWRDSKNKGKPKGKFGKARSAEGSAAMDGTQGKLEGEAVSTETKKPTGKPRAPKRKKNVKVRGSKKMDIKVRASEEGWVGNR